MGYNKSKRIALALRDIQNKEELKTLPRTRFGSSLNQTYFVNHPTGGKFIIKDIHGPVDDNIDNEHIGHVRKRYKHELLRSSLNNILGIDGPNTYYLNSQEHPNKNETHTLAIEHLPEGTKPLALHPEILYADLGSPEHKTNAPGEPEYNSISSVLSRTDPNQLEKLSVLDWILNAQDRHLNNYMLSPDNKKLYSIDHEITGPENVDIINPPHSIIDTYIAKNPNKSISYSNLEAFTKNKQSILSNVYRHLFSVMSPEKLKEYLTDISKKINLLDKGLKYKDLVNLYKNHRDTIGNMADRTQKV